MLKFGALGLLAIFCSDAFLRGQTTLLVPSPTYSSIQSAIVAAANGDTVQVAAGTYYEHINFLGKAIIVRGAGPATTTIDGSGTVGSVVNFVNDEQATSVLDGFKITGGTGTPTIAFSPSGLTTVYCGGGIVVGVAQGALSPFHAPKIQNCNITGNSSSPSYGAGIHCFVGCSIRVTNCEISYNSGGNGIHHMSAGSSVIANCSVIGNSGIGISATGRSDILEDCVVIGNGGGVAISSSSVDSVVRRCVISNNNGTAIGGIWVYSAAVRIECSLISGNTSVSSGSGVICSLQTSLSWNNPGVSDVRIVNSTVVGNSSAGTTGGVIATLGGTVGIINSIVRGNTGLNVSTQQSGVVSASFSNIQGGFGGSMDLDPLFVSAATGNYRLSAASPCINAGTSSLIAASPGGFPAYDFFGKPRNLNGGVDMGFDETDYGGVGAALEGTVGTTTALTPVLRVNGSTGGVAHSVPVGLGQSIEISVDQPPTNGNPSLFALFGVLAIPTYADGVLLPFGIGSMAFVPCPLYPAGIPLVFTLTNNFGPDPCASLVLSHPTPWTSPPFAGIPLAFDVTLQGVIEQSPGVIRVTNGVVVKIR